MIKKNMKRFTTQFSPSHKKKQERLDQSLRCDSSSGKKVLLAKVIDRVDNELRLLKLRLSKAFPRLL